MAGENSSSLDKFLVPQMVSGQEAAQALPEPAKPTIAQRVNDASTRILNNLTSQGMYPTQEGEIARLERLNNEQAAYAKQVHAKDNDFGWSSTNFLDPETSSMTDRTASTFVNYGKAFVDAVNGLAGKTDKTFKTLGNILDQASIPHDALDAYRRVQAGKGTVVFVAEKVLNHGPADYAGIIHPDDGQGDLLGGFLGNELEFVQAVFLARGFDFEVFPQIGLAGDDLDHGSGVLHQVHGVFIDELFAGNVVPDFLGVHHNQFFTLGRGHFPTHQQGLFKGQRALLFRARAAFLVGQNLFEFAGQAGNSLVIRLNFSHQGVISLGNTRKGQK